MSFIKRVAAYRFHCTLNNILMSKCKPNTRIFGFSEFYLLFYYPPLTSPGRGTLDFSPMPSALRP